MLLGSYSIALINDVSSQKKTKQHELIDARYDKMTTIKVQTYFFLGEMPYHIYPISNKFTALNMHEFRSVVNGATQPRIVIFKCARYYGHHPRSTVCIKRPASNSIRSCVATVHEE
jgi:hypothetical protein